MYTQTPFLPSSNQASHTHIHIPVPMHHPITSSPSQLHVLFPISSLSVDINVYHPRGAPSLMLILSLNRSLSRFVPTLLTLSLGATLAAYPIPLTTLIGNGICLALSTTELLLSTSLSIPECITLLSLSIGTIRIVVVLTGGGGDCFAVDTE